MLNHSKLIMQPPYHLNLATKIWQIIGANGLLRHAFPEYFKPAIMLLTLVLGFVEDERAFSTVNFVKGKLQNKLVEHLPLCVKMFIHKSYTLCSFPYQEAVDIWKYKNIAIAYKIQSSCMYLSLCVFYVCRYSVVAGQHNCSLVFRGWERSNKHGCDHRSCQDSGTAYLQQIFSTIALQQQLQNFNQTLSYFH